jgi:hypothetical protein
MAAKLRPRVILPGIVSSAARRTAESPGRQLQRLVGQRGAELLGSSGLARWLIVSTVENSWMNAPEAKEA